MATSVPDIERLRLDFCSLILRAKGATVAHFVAWLDLKVAEYKVYGHMILTNEETDNQPMWQDATSDPSSWPSNDPPVYEGVSDLDYGQDMNVGGSEPAFKRPKLVHKARIRHKPAASHSPMPSAATHSPSPMAAQEQSNTFPDSQTPALMGDILNNTGVTSAESAPSVEGETAQVIDVKPKIETLDKDMAQGFSMQVYEASSSSVSVPPVPKLPSATAIRNFMSPRGRGRGGSMRGSGMRGRGGVRFPTSRPVQTPRIVPEHDGSLMAATSPSISGKYNSCNLCNKTFGTEKELIWHMQSHAVNKESGSMFVCNICGKGFPAKGNLRQHQICHIDLNFSPFSCQYCQRPFNRKQNLQRHERNCSASKSQPPSLGQESMI